MARLWRAAAGAGALLVAAACGGADDQAGGGATGGGGGAPLVLATTTVWADVVAAVACDGLARVEALIPPGVDSHSFEPSLADRGRLEEAALVVANGLALEEGLLDTLAAAEDDGVPVLRIADHVSSGASGGGAPAGGDDHGATGAEDHGDDHGGGEDHGHEHDGDPHLWLDPRNVDRALDPLADRLVAEAGLDPDAVASCRDRYRDQLAEVDAEVAAIVDQLPPQDRLLVTSHDSFGHFADRYGFEVVGTIAGSTSSLAEADPAALEELAQLIERSGIEAIFTDVGGSDDDARAVAERVGGVAVVPLHTESLGAPGSGAETYLDLLRTNARLVVDGLGGGA